MNDDELRPGDPTDSASNSHPSIPNYELVSRLGTGGFGDVWLARERLTGVIRAAKLLPKVHAKRADRDLKGVRRYQHCANDHPHLVQILTVGETETHYYYVMEIADLKKTADANHKSNSRSPSGSDHVGISGDTVQPMTLATILRHDKRIAPTAALEWIRKLATAVARLHEQGLRHNDLKPENVLIIKGEPKIADLSLMNGHHETPLRAGTLSYLTPEGEPNDLYALGKILYQLVSGLGADEFPRLPAHLMNGRESAMPAIVAVFNRACHPSSNRRYVKVIDFQKAIDRAAAGYSRRRLHRRIKNAGVLVLVAVAGVSSFIVFRAMKPEIERYHDDGSIYTLFDARRCKFDPPNPGRNEPVTIELDYVIKGLEGHILTAAIALDSKPDPYLIVYEGKPGQEGVKGSYKGILVAPAGGAYDVRLYVTHETGDEFRKNVIVAGNMSWFTLREWNIK